MEQSAFYSSEYFSQTEPQKKLFGDDGAGNPLDVLETKLNRKIEASETQILSAIAKIKPLAPKPAADRKPDAKLPFTAKAFTVTDPSMAQIKAIAKRIGKRDTPVFVVGYATEVVGRDYRDSLAYKRAEVVAGGLRNEGVVNGSIILSTSQEFHPRKPGEDVTANAQILGAYVYIGKN